MHGECHFRPWEIDELSLGHAILALTDPDQKGPPAGHTYATPEQQKAHAARVRSMTGPEWVAMLEKSR